MGRKERKGHKDVDCADDISFRLSSIMTGCDDRGSGRSSDGAGFKMEGAEKLSEHCEAEMDEEQQKLPLRAKIAACAVAVIMLLLIGLLAKVRLHSKTAAVNITALPKPMLTA
jgi:hypothetical protein